MEPTLDAKSKAPGWGLKFGTPRYLNNNALLRIPHIIFLLFSALAKQ
jgi:hypothetical protein